MFIRSLILNNFRNFGKADFEFKRINFVIGKNGAGKTNLLESLVLLSRTKSQRRAKTSSLITFAKKIARIEALVVEKEEKKRLSLVLRKDERKPKLIKKNGLKMAVVDFIGCFKTVFFAPDELMIILGPPALRRRFLDIFLIGTDQNYLRQLLLYQKGCRNRNKLLEKISSGKAQKDELFFWNQLLAESGTYLIKKREKAVKFLNQKLPLLYQKISQDSKKAALQYKKSLSLEKKGGSKEYQKILESRTEQDIKLKTTLFGPHRDDLLFYLAKKTAKETASRGEIRTLILSLKIAEAAYIFKVTKTKPVILLDDIFSELDKSRIKNIFGVLKKNQVFITSTAVPLKLKKSNNVRIIKLKQSATPKKAAQTLN